MDSFINLIPDIIVSLVTAFLPWFIPLLYKELQRQKLASLNKFLICDTKPFKYLTILPFYFFWVKIIAVGLSFATILSLTLCLIGKENNLWLYIGISAVFFWILYWLMCGPLCRKDIKGLVGIIRTDLRGVADIPAPADNCIYFATHDIPGGGVYSYEERTPITDEKEIAKIREEKIVKYYNSLRHIIDTESHDKNLFKLDVPGYGEMHVCDFMTQCAYTTKSLTSAIREVCDNMVNDNSINFIGDKVGVESFNIDNGYLSLGIYLTDHFTFKVFKHIFKDGKYKECFQLLIRRINRARMEDKALICRCLKFLFSSFGLDIIVFGQKADRNKGVLLAVRAGKIEQNKQSNIHVPVNESFSLTDMKNNDHFSLKDCALRGIEEELGIPQSYLNPDILKFTDFAIVSDEGEIGLGCSADLTNVMTLEEATLFPGQDKFLEIKELFVLDMPPFKWDTRKYPEYFYFKTDNSTLTTSWQSFTPLLYQRLAVRERRLSHNFINALSFAALICVLVSVEYIFNFTTFDYLSETVCYGITIIILLCKIIYDYVRHRPNRIRPLVPQWNGDARCLQSVNVALGDSKAKELKDRNPVMWYMMFGLEKSKGNDTNHSIPLSELRLTEAPWCAVRHELVKNHAESPVSFYAVVHDNNPLEDNSINIVDLPLYYSNGILELTISCNYEKERWNYRFIKSIESPLLEFGNPLKPEEVLSYSRLFGVKESFLQNLIIGRFNTTFCNNYTLFDLFSYQDKYYWSATRKRTAISDRIISEINAKTDIFGDFIRPHEMYSKLKNFEISIKGPADIMLKKLTDFISYPVNLNRIPAMDIYMLQLALARMGTNIRPLLLVKRR